MSETERSKEDPKILKAQCIADLIMLRNPSSAISDERATGNIFAKERDAYLLTVKNLLNIIILRHLISEQNMLDEIRDKIKRLESMLAEIKQKKIQKLRDEPEGLKDIPESIKSKIAEIESEARSRNASIEPSEIINQFKNPQDREHAAIYFLLKGADSRMPPQGKVPDDIVKLRQGQVLEVDRIINETLALLESR